MKFIWSSSAFSVSATEGDTYATGYVEHVPGSASDPLVWNWRARCARPGRSLFENGAAPTEQAARAAVEKTLAAFVAKLARAA